MNKLSDLPSPASGLLSQSALFDNSPLPGCVLEASSFRFVITNKAFLEFFGYPASELSTLSFDRLVAPAFRQHLQQVLRQHPPAAACNEVLEQFTADGRLVTTDLFFAPLPSPGRVLWQVTVVDITDRQALIANLAADRERYKVYIDQSSEGIYCQTFRNPPSIDGNVDSIVALLQHDGAITECNQAMARMYGFDTPSELIGTMPAQLLDFSDPATTEYLKTFVKNGFSMVDAESHEKDRFGNPRYFLNNLVGIVKDRKLQCIWGTQRDITEKKEAELKLKESEKRFQEVAESAPVMITMCGIDDKITYANQRFLSFTGLDAKACASLDWARLVHEADIPIAIDKFNQSFAQRQPVTLVYRMRNAQGEYRWVQDTSVPRHLEDGTFLGYIGSLVDIHDTKLKEEQLQRHAAVLEHVVDIILTTDFNYCILSLNKEAEQAFGVRESDVLGRPLGQVVHLHIISSSRKQAEEDFAREGIWKGEVCFVDHKGETRYLLQTVSYLYDAEGQRQAIMSVGRDITDRKLAQEQLNQSERFYRSLIADSLDGMILMDSTGHITFASPSVEHILGYSPEEILGTNGFSYVHPDDLLMAWNAFQREVQENPQVKFITIRLRRKKSDWVWCLVRGHNLLGNPYVNSLAIYFHDDTMRKQASDALKESERRFRQLVRDLQFGVAMQDGDCRVLMCNGSLLRIFCLNEEELVGNVLSETVEKIIWENGSPARKEDLPLATAIQTKKPVRNVVLGIYHPRLGERKWILVSTDPVLDENGNLLHVLCTISDITDRKKLEQKLLTEQINHQKLLTQATIDGQEKERREIGKELHDNIGQQLTTTKLFLDLAKSTADDTTAEMISMALKGISDVINEVRQMSRSLMPPSLGDLGLMESITDLAETISRTQYVRIDLDDYDFAEGRVPDNQKLMVYRIIQEQLNNIVKHAEARKVVVTLRNDRGCLELKIQDDGKGFDLQKVRKGLGITNMKNRAELFGGTLTIDSVPGRGCTLTVRVPEQEPEGGTP